MQAFLVKLIVALLEKIGVSIAEIVMQYISERTLNRVTRERVQEVMSEEDPKTRARRMRDLINTL